MKQESKADILLHPVRIRIIQALINKRELTVQQIGERLADIPQASLYRHLKKLLEADLIMVVDEKQSRGAVEKVYALPEHAETLTGEDIEKATPEEHMSYFLKFLSTVMADFERYLSQDQFNFRKDGAGYRQMTFYATDEELKEFNQTVSASLKKLLKNEKDEGRKMRTLTTILTSENEKKKKD